MSPDSPRGCGRQPKESVPLAPSRGPALKSCSMRRKSHLDCIAGNNGQQLSVKVEDLLQIAVHGQHEYCHLQQNYLNITADRLITV